MNFTVARQKAAVHPHKTLMDPAGGDIANFLRTYSKNLRAGWPNGEPTPDGCAVVQPYFGIVTLHGCE